MNESDMNLSCEDSALSEQVKKNESQENNANEMNHNEETDVDKLEMNEFKAEAAQSNILASQDQVLPSANDISTYNFKEATDNLNINDDDMSLTIDQTYQDKPILDEISDKTLITESPNKKYIQDIDDSILTQGAIELYQDIFVTESISSSNFQGLNNIINYRVNHLNQMLPTISNINSKGLKRGVASGDNKTMSYNIWFNPFYGFAKQKGFARHTAHSVNSAGGSIGIDIINDNNNIFGIVGTIVNSKIKYTNSKIGHDIKGNSYILSIYGTQNLSHKSFLQETISIYNSDIQNNRGYKTNNQDKNAKGKYTSIGYDMQGLLGYNYNPSQSVTLTPLFGLHYSQTNDAAYTIMSLTGVRDHIEKKSSDRLDTVVGIRSFITYRIQNNIIFTPELHAFVNYNCIGRRSKINANLNDRQTLATIGTSKPIRTTYIIGSSWNINHRSMEYAMSHDINLAKKYVGHQAMIRVKIHI
jgi:outer membrane autotransporter protein